MFYFFPTFLYAFVEKSLAAKGSSRATPGASLGRLYIIYYSHTPVAMADIVPCVKVYKAEVESQKKNTSMKLALLERTP